MKPNVAIVTGAGRGIGKQIAWELHYAGVPDVVVSARLQSDADAVCAEFRPKNPASLTPLQLDVAAADGLAPLAAHLRARRCDRLLPAVVANAAVTSDAWTADALSACVAVNCVGAARTAETALSACGGGGAKGRYVFVSSGWGQQCELSPRYRRALCEGYAEACAAVDAHKTTAFDAWQTCVMGRIAFVADDPLGTVQAPAYKLSKAAMNVYARLLARQLARDSPEAAAAGAVAVYCVDPGWVRTRMGGSSATRSIEEGASWPVKLALGTEDPSTPRPPLGDALFISYGHVLDW